MNLHLEPFSSVLMSGLMGDMNGGHMSLENLKSAGHTWFNSGSRCYHSNQRPGLMALRLDFTLYTCLRQNQEKKDATLNIVPPFPLIACTIHLSNLCSAPSLCDPELQHCTAQKIETWEEKIHLTAIPSLWCKCSRSDGTRVSVQAAYVPCWCFN